MRSPLFLSRLLVILLAVVIVFASAIPAHAQAPEVPPGFRPAMEAPGVKLYRKDYSGGAPDFVQVVNLAMGAGVGLLHAPISDSGKGQGVYGGDNPDFQRRSLQNYWRDAASQSQNLFCVTNGAFFYMPEYPGPLPFPLKKDGVVMSDGYAINEFVGEKLLLEIWEDRVDIRDLTAENLYGSTAPNILGGLTEEAHKAKPKYVGRTFVGADDRNGDGLYEVFLVFSTLSARQVDAAQVLRSFGADKIMMLDGGGSTQLTCQGKAMISSERLIPQALWISAGPGMPDILPEPVLAGVQPSSTSTTGGGEQPETVPVDPLLLAASLGLQPPPSEASNPAPAEAAPAAGQDQGVQVSQPAEAPLVEAFTVQPMPETDSPALAPADAQTAEAEAAVELPALRVVDEAAREPRMAAASIPEPVLSISFRDGMFVPLIMAPFILLLFLAVMKVRQPAVREVEFYQ